jgi:hypothetical protein
MDAGGRATHGAVAEERKLFRQSERGNNAALFTSDSINNQGADDKHPKQTKRIVKKHGSFLLSMILGQSKQCLVKPVGYAPAIGLVSDLARVFTHQLSMAH